MDPFSVVSFSTQASEVENSAKSQWRLCQLSENAEKTIFESFLNVLKIREKSGYKLDNQLRFQANYSVKTESNFERKITFIKKQFRGAPCTEVRRV